MERLTPLYVYWLRAPMLNSVVVYVGCARDVEARRKDAQRRYNMTLSVTRSKPYTDFKMACERETLEISRHWMTIFNIVQKSSVSAAYEDRRRKISDALLGRVKSPIHRHHISMAMTGKTRGPLSEEIKRKIGDGNRGKIVSQTTRDLIRAATTGVKQSLLTIAKRASKNRGKKRTAEQIAHLSAAKRGVPWTLAMRIAKDLQYLRRSGWGHPWRLECLDAKTARLVG